MAIEAKMKHLPPGDHPNRCNAFDGQDRSPCLYQALEGTPRCEMHGGYHYERHAAKKALRSYQIEQWKNELDKFHDSDSIKSLREEIAIARMTLQATLQMCHDQYDLILHTQKIALLLDKIQTLVVSCNKLEDRLGLVLDKSAIINLAENIVQIVGAHVDEETLALVADQIATAVQESGRVPLKSIL